MPKEVFQKAKDNKNDEFYTLLDDIENEVKHYWSQLEGKKIWCNCDDPEWSNFYHFFENQKPYHNFEVKFTCYRILPDDKTNYHLTQLNKTLTKQEGGKGIIIQTDQVYVDEDGYCQGDFRAKEQQELWEWADVIITNPPFSLFREFVDYLMKYNKKFLIIGNKGAIAYKEIFKLIKNEKMWVGHNLVNNFTNVFDVPSSSPALWFTNLDTEIRHREIDLIEWDDKKYLKYENYNAYETFWIYGIPKHGGKNQIPFTNKILGVPITFLLKHNPEQFKIIGGCAMDFEPNKYNKCIQLTGKTKGSITTNCKGVVYIKTTQKYADYQNIDNKDYYRAPYSRIFIQLTDEYYNKYKNNYESEVS